MMGYLVSFLSRVFFDDFDISMTLSQSRGASPRLKLSKKRVPRGHCKRMPSSSTACLNKKGKGEGNNQTNAPPLVVVELTIWVEAFFVVRIVHACFQVQTCP